MQLHIPAWVGSVIFHTIGLLLLFLFVRPDTEIRGAPGVERVGQIGIALKSDSDQGTVYRTETETFESQPANVPSGGSQGDMPLTEIANSFDPGAFLPSPMENVIGPTAVTASGNAEQIVNRAGTGGFGTGTGTGTGSGAGGGATVSVFGLEGTGHRFAFVFDRSDSMTEQGGKPIRAAKAELIRSIDSLGSVHQLLIVLYNEDTMIYPKGEQSARLIYATDDNKESAKRFIRSIVPAGGTNHEKALSVAAKQRPDVIFLLTDGESKDDLNISQLDRITKVSGGIQINVIQFGIGPEPRSRNYLKILATQNAGLYQYIDIGKL